MAQYDFDIVIIGAGSGGLTAVNFAAELGARVALVEKHRIGAAQFVDSHTIQVNDRQISSKYFLLTTDAHPFIPPISGLDDVSYLTYEQIFENGRLPTR